MYIECFQHSLAHRRALLNLPDNLATRGQRMIPKQNSIASFVPRITRVLRLQTHKCRPLSSPSDSLPTVRETRIVPLVAMSTGFCNYLSFNCGNHRLKALCKRNRTIPRTRRYDARTLRNINVNEHPSVTGSSLKIGCGRGTNARHPACRK